MLSIRTIIRSLLLLITIDGCDLMLERGKYLRGTKLATINKIGQKQCAKRCFVTSNCLSYNFQRIHLSCELLLQNSSMVNLVDRQHSSHEDVDISYEFPESTCQYNSQGMRRVSLQKTFNSCNCASGTMCVRIKNGTVCVQIACKKLPLPTVQNGYPRVDQRTYYLTGEKVTYACRMGYRMAGASDSITCKENGDWESTRNITCSPVDCGAPPSYIWKGKIDSSIIERTYRKCVSYRCETGYTLFGHVRFCCNHVGQWGGLRCHPVSCGNAPPAPIGSEMVSPVSKGWYTDEKYYGCVPGYTYVAGLNFTVCQANRLWTNVDINCTKVSCGKPELKDFAILDSDDEGLYLDVRKYTCTNYPLGHQDPLQIMCQASGNWTPIICNSDPVNFSEISTIQESTFLGSTIWTDSYQTSTETSTTDNVTFGNFWETTTVIDCGHPPAIWKQRSVHYSATTIGKRALYSCESGYNVFRRNVRCGSNGHWSSGEFCHPVSCGHVPLPNGLNVTSIPPFGWYQDQKNYTCSHGYQYNGGSTYTKCQANSKWTNPTINCTKV